VSLFTVSNTKEIQSLSHLRSELQQFYIKHTTPLNCCLLTSQRFTTTSALKQVLELELELELDN